MRERKTVMATNTLYHTKHGHQMYEIWGCHCDQ